MTRYLLTALAVTLGLFMSRPANAAFSITLTANGISESISDGDAGDASPLANLIVINSELVGSYTFTGTFAVNNSPGDANSAFLVTGTNFVSGSGATTVSIEAFADGFTLPSSPPDVNVISGATIQYQAGTVSGNTADVSYQAFVNADLVGGGVGDITAPGGNENLGQTTVYTIPSTPYSLTLKLEAVLNDDGANNIDLDGTLELQPTPEPATLAMWGIGAMGVLIAGRFRRKSA